MGISEAGNDGNLGQIVGKRAGGYCEPDEQRTGACGADGSKDAKEYAAESHHADRPR